MLRSLDIRDFLRLLNTLWSIEMPTELDIIKEVVSRLDEAAVPYMITGSIAANFYAVSRMTRDIDVIIELTPSRALS
jgi:hypothetical protein